MATINDLQKSISEMSDEEIFLHIRQIRASRREFKPIKAKKSRKTPKQKLTIDQVSGKLSKQQNLKLLESLERRMKDANTV